MFSNRRSQRRALLLPLLILMAGSVLHGQTTNGGSSYSIFNIGDLQTGSSASVAGRSGVEVAIPSSEILNTINPAAWSDLRYTTIQASLAFNQYRVSDANASISQNDTRLRDFAFGVKWSETLGGAAGISLRPYSTVNYRTSQTQMVPGDDSSTTARVDYSGRGGVSTAAIGMSIRPHERMAIGVTANLYFGTITGISDVSFPGTASTLNPATYESSSRFTGTGLTVGAWGEPIDNLRIGLAFDAGASLTRGRIELSRFVQNGLSYVHRDTLPDNSLTIPPRLTFGLSYRTGRFLFGGDYWMQNWSKDAFSTTRSAFRIAGGVDRLASSSVNAGGFERWTFRLGGFYEHSYYSLGEGSVDAIGGSLGFRWPVTQVSPLSSSTVLDLAIEGGTRGSLDNGLTQEVFGRLYVGLSLNELWFLRRR